MASPCNNLIIVNTARERNFQQTSPELDIYRRLPLTDTNSIRLLRLKPYTDVASSILEAELYVATLSEVRRSFDALSYTWNSQIRDSLIQINGVYTWIGQNLNDFLLRIRDHGIDVPLWADAICINQDSNEEKNHQVRLMGNIYSSARCTRLWLGNELIDLSKLMQIYTEHECIRWEQNIVSGLCIDAKSLLDSLLYHPYWQRTWIIQEILLASEIQIHCNSQVLFWDDFMTVTKRICAKVGQSCLAIYGQSSMKKLDTQITKRPRQTLPNLLEKYGSTNCGDLRDRVFAMIGLIDADDDPLKPGTEEAETTFYVLDYSVSLPVLFTRLLEVYSRSAPASFVTRLWDAFQLDIYPFATSQSNITFAIAVRCLVTIVLPASDSTIFARTFSEDDEEAGTWAQIEFPWCSQDRLVYWKLRGGPFEDDFCRTGPILGSAVSWASNDAYRKLSELGQQYCETARSVNVVSSRGAASGQIEAELSVLHMRDLLRFDQFQRTHIQHVSAPEVKIPPETGLHGVEICITALRSVAEDFSDTLLRMSGWHYKDTLDDIDIETIYVANIARVSLLILNEWVQAIRRDSIKLAKDFRNGHSIPTHFKAWETCATYALQRCQCIKQWRHDHFSRFKAPFSEIDDFLKPIWEERKVQELGFCEEKLMLKQLFAEIVRPKKGVNMMRRTSAFVVERRSLLRKLREIRRVDPLMASGIQISVRTSWMNTRSTISLTKRAPETISESNTSIPKYTAHMNLLEHKVRQLSQEASE